jgi:hypothetical protein
MPIVAAARRLSASFVLAALRAFHVDCLLADGKKRTYRTMPICIQSTRVIGFLSAG